MSVSHKDLLVSAFLATSLATGVTPSKAVNMEILRAITSTTINFFCSLSDTDHTYHKHYSCGKPKHPVK